MSDVQIQEVTTTRKIPENVYVVSPADGFIVARNIAPGLRFERHMDLYTIADLGRVWIFAQVSNREAGELHPGTEARVSLPDTGERFIARVSTVLPEIDPVTHTLMLRLEADNPGFRLRPNMYVDVEFHVARSSRLTVPADAVLNAGLSKRVFVETSEGNFEPREVETGWALGDRVQIVSGLTAGETVASAGTFLIDSESRLQPSQKLVHSGERISAHQVLSSVTSDAMKNGALEAMTAWMRRIIDLSVRHKAVVFAAVSVGCVCGYWSIATMQLDAIPDLGDVQVIISSRWDRTPQLIEDQVTYPIVSAMLGAPHVKTVRGVSDFGYSFVYVIFDDNTDLYWARSRTLEYLSGVQAHLPEGVKTEIGPDATSLGWVFQYALVDTSGQHSSSDLRAYQDWYLRNYLKAVPGVA